MRKVWLISKFITSQTEQQIIAIHTLPNIPRSKSNQSMNRANILHEYFYSKIMRQGD